MPPARLKWLAKAEPLNRFRQFLDDRRRNKRNSKPQPANHPVEGPGKATSAGQEQDHDAATIYLPCSPQLTGMPAEIIHEIVDYLNPSDILALKLVGDARITSLILRRRLPTFPELCARLRTQVFEEGNRVDIPTAIAQRGHISIVSRVLNGPGSAHLMLPYDLVSCKAYLLLHAAAFDQLALVKYLVDEQQASLTVDRQVYSYHFYRQIYGPCFLPRCQQFTALHAAVQSNHIQVVRFLLAPLSNKVRRKKPFTTYVQRHFGHGPQNWMTALHVAASNGNNEMVKLLLDAGVRVNYSHKCQPQTCSPIQLKFNRKRTFRTAIHCAAEAGRADTIILLLDEGANANALDENHRTALHFAAMHGHISAMEVLLNKGKTKIDGMDANGATALSLAIMHDREAVVTTLLENGANAVQQHIISLQPLTAAAKKGKVTAAAQIVKYGAVVTETDLLHAAKAKDIQMVHFLLRHIEPGLYDEFCHRLLVSVSGDSMNPVFDSLLINPTWTMASKKVAADEALVQAAALDQVRLVRVLLPFMDGYLSEDEKDGVTGSALIAAAAAGRDNVIIFLLSRGANVNREYYMRFEGKNGRYRAIHVAARKGHSMTVRLLVLAGADVAAVDSQNRTALHHAALNDHPLVVCELTFRGAQMEVRDTGGCTPLMLAATHLKPFALEMLLQTGHANPNSIDGNLLKPLYKVRNMECDPCMEETRQKVEEMLVRYGGRA